MIECKAPQVEVEQAISQVIRNQNDDYIPKLFIYSPLRYNAYLNEIAIVSSEVVISPPDMREGYEETDDETTHEVVKFWQKMMKRYGNEEEYTKQRINQFKHSSEPEILIVVDKLLTGFDAPRNAVLYLCRVLRELTLLQAIARVNRLHEGKKADTIAHATKKAITEKMNEDPGGKY